MIVRALSFLMLLIAATGAPASHHSATLRAAPAPTTDSTVDDLRGVVVLCATQPGSSAFTNAWAAWLREHPDADVETTISEVLRRANTTSSMTRGLASPASYHVRDERIADHMRVTARSIRLESRQPGASRR